jgi:putative ABC transport system permease protein
MFSPRWKKVIGDLWSNPTRTALVVMSIFVGVFAVGLITGTQAIVVREMNEVYRSANPANATISVSDADSFDDGLVQSVENMDEVGIAEGRRSYSARVQGSVGDWQDITFTGVEDFDDVQINQFYLLRGQMPPPRKEVLVEQSGLDVLQKEVGDVLLVELPDGEQLQMPITGVVESPTSGPAQFSGITTYVTMDTMEWLSGERDFNQMLILSAENRQDIEHNREVAEVVYEKIQKSERDPSFPNVSDGQHPLNDFISAMVAILGGMGVMSVFLSAFLVTNTIAALLAQQSRQIGIMKSIGARGNQIIGMYMVLVLVFGVLALALAYPLGVLGTNAFAGGIASFFNIELRDTSVPFYVIATQMIISLGVPVIAALYPVFSGTRVTVREAMSEGGGASYGESIVDRIIQRVRAFPRPVLLSLRNTFRRKGRVALTLMTLTLGGAIFIGVFSVRDSLLLTFEDILNSLFNYDVAVTLERDYREDYVVSEALRVPGVTEAETWRVSGARRVNPDGTEGSTITMWGVPAQSNMVQPTVISGRWLLPSDENAIVLSSGVLETEDDIEVGDEIVVSIQGRDTTWRVVGEAVTIGSAAWGYVRYDAYGRAAREVGAAASLYVRTDPRTPETQNQVATALDEHFTRLGINVVGTQTGSNIREQQATFVNVIIIALLAMAVLIAVVGGLGLMGTMSLNVLERTREIGIMRAIGASDGRVLQVVMIEGLVLGLLSWMLGALLAFPISQLLSNQVGMLLFSFPLSFSFSPLGAGLWLAIALVLSAVASFLPAWNASRVTVRDVLAYE